MKGVTIEKTTALKEPFAGISESRDGTWDWSSTHQPTRLASPDLLVHRVAAVFALCYSLWLSVGPLVGRLERKAALVFISRSSGSLLTP